MFPRRKRAEKKRITVLEAVEAEKTLMQEEEKEDEEESKYATLATMESDDEDTRNSAKDDFLANTYKGMYRLTVAGSHLIGNLRLLCLLCLFCLLCCDCGIIVGGCHDVLLLSFAFLLLCFFVVAVHVCFFFQGALFF